MNSGGGCCGGNLFTSFEPAKQAEYLAMLANDARLLQFSIGSNDPDTKYIGDQVQRALEQAMDADAADEAEAAQRQLEQVLRVARNAGLVLSAELGEVDVEGALGMMRMRVLTTVLAPPQPQPQDA